jgi:hypothetical protein
LLAAPHERREQAEERPYERRLAAAVRPYDGDDLAWLDGEGNVAHERAPPVANRQSFRLQDGGRRDGGIRAHRNIIGG